MRLQSVKVKSVVGYRIREEGQQQNPVSVPGWGVLLPALGVRPSEMVWTQKGRGFGASETVEPQLAEARALIVGEEKGRSSRKKEASFAEAYILLHRAFVRRFLLRTFAY